MRALVLVAILMAGCAAPANIGEALQDTPWVVPQAPPVGVPEHVFLECPPACVLRVNVPELSGDQALELLFSWDGTQVNPTIDGVTLVRGFDSARALLHNGTHDIEIDTSLSLRMRILGPTTPFLLGAEELPNIVTYAPVQVGVAGCDEVESTEQEATRCLRLGNAIGNTGDGPLQVDLSLADGALSPTGLGAFSQIIRMADGTTKSESVGNADFHLAHAHFHYDGFARFSLFEWDAETGLRGAEAAKHHKSGFCFLDWGAMQEEDRAPAEGGRAEADCLIPTVDGWSMGISVGWFDFYWSALTDQYIDIAGVPDGTYELVSEADWSNSLRETDEGDNAASVVMRLTGDEVEIIESRGYYIMPESTTNL